MRQLLTFGADLAKLPGDKVRRREDLANRSAADTSPGPERPGSERPGSGTALGGYGTYRHDHGNERQGLGPEDATADREPAQGWRPAWPAARRASRARSAAGTHAGPVVRT